MGRAGKKRRKVEEGQGTGVMGNGERIGEGRGSKGARPVWSFLIKY